MRIDVQTVRGSTSGRRANSKAAAGGFADLVEHESSPSTAMNAAPLSSVQVSDLILLQAADDNTERSKRNARAMIAANTMLDELEHMQRAIILGGITSENLTTLSRSLASSAQQSPVEGDLHAVVAAIELRVAVEKAKLECAKEHAVNNSTFGVLSANRQAAIARADSQQR
jgi:Class II flagellar assembly regulator